MNFLSRSLLFFLIAFASVYLFFIVKAFIKKNDNRAASDYRFECSKKILHATLVVALLFIFSRIETLYTFAICLEIAGLYFFYEHYRRFKEETKHSILKLPEKVREPYDALLDLLGCYMNSYFAEDIIEKAHQRLLLEADMVYSPLEKDYFYNSRRNYASYLLNERNVDSMRYSDICKTWALCFTICNLEKKRCYGKPLENDASHAATALYDNAASRLEMVYSDEYVCPLVFLALFAHESPFIAELFDKVENYDERAEMCLNGYCEAAEVKKIKKTYPAPTG